MTTTHDIDTDAVLRAYIDCALWSTSIDEDFAKQHNASTGEDWAADTGMLDFGFTAEDLAPTTLDVMRAEVEDFLQTIIPFTQRAFRFWAEQLGAEQIGHDFWLTRNGHGAGFWDRFASDPGESFGRQLSEQAKHHGESWLYVGDDGRVYVS